MPTLKQAHYVIPLLGLLFSLAACSTEQAALEINEAWSRPSTPSARNSAFYMTIDNKGSLDDSLVAGQSTACGEVQIHESAMDDQGVMAMQQISAIALPAGDTVTLEVGGLHLMCLDRQRDFAPGDSIPLTLTFKESGDVALSIIIREQ